MPRMIKYTLIIEETFGRSTGQDRNGNKKYPEWKKEIMLPVDSENKHVYKQMNRATMDLLYALADHGYLNVLRAISDLLNYEESTESTEEESEVDRNAGGKEL